MDPKEIFLAEERKGLSIAFFNANNNASQLVASLKPKSADDAVVMVRAVRAEFLNDYYKFWKENISKVGEKASEKEIEDAVASAKSIEDVYTLEKKYRSIRQQVRDDRRVHAAFMAKKGELDGTAVISVDVDED